MMPAIRTGGEFLGSPRNNPKSRFRVPKNPEF
jgi:hypothetical protein